MRNPRYQLHLTPKLALFCQCHCPPHQVHLGTPEEPAAAGARSVACSEEGGVVRDRFKWAGSCDAITTVPTSKYIHRKHSRPRVAQACKLGIRKAEAGTSRALENEREKDGNQSSPCQLSGSLHQMSVRKLSSQGTSAWPLKGSVGYPTHTHQNHKHPNASVRGPHQQEKEQGEGALSPKTEAEVWNNGATTPPAQSLEGTLGSSPAMRCEEGAHEHTRAHSAEVLADGQTRRQAWSPGLADCGWPTFAFVLGGRWSSYWGPRDLRSQVGGAEAGGLGLWTGGSEVSAGAQTQGWVPDPELRDQYSRCPRGGHSRLPGGGQRPPPLSAAT